MLATFTFTAYANVDLMTSGSTESVNRVAVVRDIIFGYHLPAESRLIHPEYASRVPDVIRSQFSDLLQHLKSLGVDPAECCYVETFRTDDVQSFVKQLVAASSTASDDDTPPFVDVTSTWDQDSTGLAVGRLIEMTDSAETFEWIVDPRPESIFNPRGMTFVLARDRKLDFMVRAIESVDDVTQWSKSDRLLRKYENFAAADYPVSRVISL